MKYSFLGIIKYIRNLKVKSKYIVSTFGGKEQKKKKERKQNKI